VAEAIRQASGNVLVVGHSNTVPEVLRHLGVADAVTIGYSEYDNLFVVMTGPQPRMLRLHFRQEECAPWIERFRIRVSH